MEKKRNIKKYGIALLLMIDKYLNKEQVYLLL